MAAPSSQFYGFIEEDLQLNQQQQPPPPPATPAKKKRNLPGNPNPDAEVIALSPKTLMATNRFICEVCNKGFQREQNLQLHRRGHNLPWKLKQKGNKDTRRKVYLCPEPTCVHHDPSRALGDLTGIKKHFSRKHGEKKWKCDKCSKRYAVQSDWKAHSKVCGTREYRCDCGTLFSRRDSFVTHRAFCDALAQESSRPPAPNSIGSNLYGNSNMNMVLSQLNSQISSDQSSGLLSLGSSGAPSNFDHLLSNHSPYYLPPSTQHFPLDNTNLVDQKPLQTLLQHPSLHSNTNASSSTAAAANLFTLGFNNSSDSGTLIPGQFRTLQVASGVSSLFSCSRRNESSAPQMSATALLQKAAQMGSTSSGGSGSGSSLLFGTRFSAGGSGSSGESFRSQMEAGNLHEIMMFGRSGGVTTFDQQEIRFGGFGAALREARMQQNILGGGVGPSDGLTRDFLGVGNLMRSMGSGIPQRELQFENGSFGPEMK